MVRITTILLLLGLLASPLLVGCSGQTSAHETPRTYAPRKQEVSVTVAPVSREALVTEIEFTGNLLPRRMTRVMAEVEGVVLEIPQIGEQIDVEVNGQRYTERLGLTYGQTVKQGDVLVKLDPVDANLALRMAEAKLKKATADLASLRAWQRPEEVQRLAALRDEVRARYERATAEFQRTEQLIQRSTISRSEYDTAAMELSTSKAALSAAEAALAQASAGPTVEDIAVQEALIAQAQAEVDQQQRRVEKTTIRAPYDGVVTAFRVEVGDWVAPSSGALVELMDLRYLSAEIAVPESHTGRVKVGDRADVHAAGAIEPVPGLVVAVNDYVDPKTRTFHVRVAIDNAARQFKAGQFANVRLAASATQAETLAVPTRSIVFVEGQPHVFVVDGDRVSIKGVQIGASGREKTEVFAGVANGDLVVVDDPSLLVDDMQLKIKQGLSNTAPQSDTERR